MNAYTRLTSSGWMQLGNDKDLTLLYSHSYNGICARYGFPTLCGFDYMPQSSGYSGSQRTARTREPVPQDLLAITVAHDEIIRQCNLLNDPNSREPVTPQQLLDCVPFQMKLAPLVPVNEFSVKFLYHPASSFM